MMLMSLKHVRENNVLPPYFFNLSFEQNFSPKMMIKQGSKLKFIIYTYKTIAMRKEDSRFC